MSTFSLLILEDDAGLREELVSFMQDFFSDIDAAENAEDAYKLFSQKSYDLLLTDIQLPKEDGLSFVKKVKKLYPEQLVIVMSAYQETEYFLTSIELQIFSFLVKPFDSKLLMETLFKITKILEDKSKAAPLNQNTSVTLSEDVFFDIQNSYLYVKNEMVMLTKKEELLLSILIKNIDGHVSELQLKKEIWDDESIADSTIRVLIKRLREKLGYDDAIINLKGRGYKITKNI